MSAFLEKWRTKNHAHLRVDLAAVTVVAALTIAAVMSVIEPALESRTMASSNSARLLADRGRITELNGALASVHLQSESAAHLTDGSLPPFGTINELNQRLSKLTELAAANDLQIDTTEPEGKSTQTPSFTLTAISMNARGGYVNCTRFLEAMHNSMKDMTVSYVDLVSPAPGEPAVLSLHLTWYSLPAATRGAR